MLVNEIENHLRKKIIPFWTEMQDKEYGGFYGLLTQELVLEREAEKGCILNSRILWFFANAYLVLKDEELLKMADHAYSFLVEHCLDHEQGGVFWSVTYDGQPLDTMKHTYNQAFAIYALASYYAASHREEAIETAFGIFHVIEDRCRDAYGYMEAFNREFQQISNEALSENGIIAKKTMNTLLHIMEAYTELYKVTGNEAVKERLCEVLDTFAEKIYDPERSRLEVFFDEKYHSLIDLHSYGHDIEASWLMDRALEVLAMPKYREKLGPITEKLADTIYHRAFDGHSVLNECENGVDNIHRIWWIQAEAMVGFVNAAEKTSDNAYMEAAESVWKYIQEYIVDHRPGSEWFWEVDEKGNPYPGRGIVEPWKCPYHNGRMCLELIQRL